MLVLVLLSLLLTISTSATKSGLGQHFLQLGSIDTARGFLKRIYIFNASYCMSTAFIKISLLLQYMRLYQRGTLLYATCRWLMILVALWGLAYSAIAWIPCNPVSDYWLIDFEVDTSNVKCYGYGSQNITAFKATYESHAAVNMLLDLLVMVLPVPLYFYKDAQTRTRLGLVGILLMGTVVNIFSIWRFATTIKHEVTTSPTFDPTWYLPITAVMAALELATACMCASIPVFWGPMAQQASKMFGLGSIFVTHEIKVETEQRLQHLDSRDAFAVDLEMQNANQSMEGSEIDLGVRSGSRLEWVDKDGLRMHYQTWEAKTTSTQ